MSSENTQAEKISEERQRKYWNLSAFYNHVKYMEEHHPGTCPADLINKFLDNQEFEAEAYRQVAEWEEDMWRHNQRLMRAIKKVKGKTFHKYMREIIQSCERVTNKIEIVKVPDGQRQPEKYGRTGIVVWVDQWSTGTEGDSFSGYVYARLKESKYLKISYSM
jgi:hypothetical protein